MFSLTKPSKKKQILLWSIGFLQGDFCLNPTRKYLKVSHVCEIDDPFVKGHAFETPQIIMDFNGDQEGQNAMSFISSSFAHNSGSKMDWPENS